MNKHEHYGRRVTTQLLVAMGTNRLEVSRMARAENFGPSWFTENCLRGDLAIDSLKLRAPFEFASVVQSPGGSECMVAWHELVQNWPERSRHALVFDYFGDAVPDLVLHDTDWGAKDSPWHLEFQDGSRTMVIQSLRSFIQVFGARYALR